VKQKTQERVKKIHRKEPSAAKTAIEREKEFCHKERKEHKKVGATGGRPSDQQCRKVAHATQVFNDSSARYAKVEDEINGQWFSELKISHRVYPERSRRV